MFYRFRVDSCFTRAQRETEKKLVRIPTLTTANSPHHADFPTIKGYLLHLKWKQINNGITNIVCYTYFENDI